MTRLTYKIVDAKNHVLESGVPTLDEAIAIAEASGARYIPEYTVIREKTHFDRSKCRQSARWLAEHPPIK